MALLRACAFKERNPSHRQIITSLGLVRPGQSVIFLIRDYRNFDWGVERAIKHVLNFEVLKDYGPYHGIHEVRSRGLMRAFHADYPPPKFDFGGSSYYEGTYGMISPEGVFYPCYSGGHSDLCYSLTEAFGLHEPGEPLDETMLHKHGWMSVHFGNLHLDYPLRPTDAQQQTIQKLTRYYRANDYRAALARLKVTEKDFDGEDRRDE